MNLIEKRRKILLSMVKASDGEIIISNANANNPVIITDADGVATTYTKATTIPIVTGTETVTMNVGKSTWGIYDGTAFTWTVDEVSSKHYPSADDSYKAYFATFKGHTYTIDSVNKTIDVQKPDNWDGFIFDRSDTRPHYPYAPVIQGAWTREGTGSSRYLECSGLKNPASTYPGTSDVLYLGPIDITGFKSITISGSSVNSDGSSSSSKGYRCTIYTDHPNDPTYGTSFEYDNDPDVDADPYMNTFTFKSGTTKIEKIHLRNLYSD